MSRFKAFAWHLGISLAIFALVLGLLILIWYPGPLFDLEGGWQGIRLVALVDVVLGPVLTLVLFKAGKPGLKFDMSMVVLLQLGALIYGMWNLYDARPVLLVHAGDHFSPLSRGLLKQWDPSGEVLKKWERMTPQQLSVEMPDDPVEYADIFSAAYRQPGQLHGLSERYRPLRQNWEHTLKDAIRIEPYAASQESWQHSLERFLQTQGRTLDELAFFPYVGRNTRAFLAFDRETREIVDVLRIPYDPALTKPEVSRMERVGLKQANK